MLQATPAVARACLALLLLGGVPTRAVAQFIGGIAVRQSTQTPLAGMTARLLRLRSAGDSVQLIDSATTDRQGAFLFNARELGVYQIEFGNATDGYFYGPVDTLTTDSVVQRRYLVGIAPRREQDPFAEAAVYRPITERRPLIRAEYPADLRARGIQGNVLASFVVDTTGRVDMSTVSLRGEGTRDFGEAVRASLAKMRFWPATYDGVPARQMVQQRFVFNLFRTDSLAPITPFPAFPAPVRPPVPR